MVSRVICNSHGIHSGLLCCDHVREAIRARENLPFAEHRLSLGSRESMPAMLCTDCATRFGLSVDEPVPDDVWSDESRFPYVAPACAACVREWSPRSRSELAHD
jgi:hypothetical protein